MAQDPLPCSYEMSQLTLLWGHFKLNLQLKSEIVNLKKYYGKFWRNSSPNKVGWC